jgi:glutaryl-CoA dehydrogenase
MKAKFNWEDPFLLQEQLTEDERAIADAAHTFCQDKLQTRVLMAARHETFDRDIMTEAWARIGLLGSHHRGLRLRRPEPRVPTAWWPARWSAWTAATAAPSACRVQPGDAPHPRLRQRGASARSTCPSLATGEWVGCFGLTEPNHGS